MRYQSLFLLLGACSSLACDKPPPGHDYQVYIDSAFDDAAQATIMQGLTNWENKTWTSWGLDNQGVTFHPVIEAKDLTGGYLYQIAIHASTPAQIQTVCYTDAMAADCALVDLDRPGLGGNIFLTAMVDPIALQHEIGHTLGLMHTGAGTIMDPHPSEVAHHITCADVDQYFSLRPGVEPACSDADVILEETK